MSSIDLKLSNFWTHFDELVKIVNDNGRINSKNDLNYFIKMNFNEGIFEGKWEDLSRIIYYIFKNDKRVQNKFNYSKEQLVRINNAYINEEGFKKLKIDLLDKWNLMINESTLQQWNTPTKAYIISDKIYLTNTIGKSNLIAKITHNKLDLSIFDILVSNDEESQNFNLKVFYNNGEYFKTINLDTGTKVAISKYREIIDFINAKYFNIYRNNLSFNEFCYLIKSFNLSTIHFKVPIISESGYLSSLDGFTILPSLNKVLDYCDKASLNNQNIKFTYDMIAYDKFIIRRPDDERKLNIRTEEENIWGKARSANGSRKGNINFDNVKNILSEKFEYKQESYYIENFDNIKLYNNLVEKYSTGNLKEEYDEKIKIFLDKHFDTITSFSKLYDLKSGDIVTIRSGYNLDMAFSVEIIGFDIENPEAVFIRWDSYWAPIDLGKRLLQIEYKS